MRHRAHFYALGCCYKTSANRSLLSAPTSITFLLPVLSIVVEFEFGLVVLIIGNDKLHEIIAESGDNVLGDCFDLIVARISCAFCESCTPRLGEALLPCERGSVELSIRSEQSALDSETLQYTYGHVANGQRCVAMSFLVRRGRRREYSREEAITCRSRGI